MKPSEKQIAFIKALRELLDENFLDWVNSNDIDSPSHYTLIDESVENSEISNKFKVKTDTIENCISLIYGTVRKVK
jgi:hypothetical protein